MLKSRIMMKKNLMSLLIVTAILLSMVTAARGAGGLDVQIPEDPFVVLEDNEDWQGITTSNGVWTNEEPP